MQLEIRNLKKNYNGKIVLKNINFIIDKGIYGILGPNGAGKSTLMNIIAGNLYADEGNVLFEDCDIQQLGKQYRKKLGYMPQQQGLYDRFTAIRFLYYMASLRAIEPGCIASRVEEVLRLVNLTGEKHKRLGAFSGGMRQRILIAQAILDSPEVLLLDEPTAGLDPKERVRIRNLISEISMDRIVILSTHVVSDIEYIADKILLMKQGELIAYATPEELCNLIQSKVFSVTIREQDLSVLDKKYPVCSIAKYGKGMVRVRFLADSVPESMSATVEEPTLEDLYLYTFRDEDVI